MSRNTNRLFTIGQFADLHQINKKTLMWYDEIGLFKPAVIRENGYRYYAYWQCSMLETILMLRELSVSVPEIKTFMEHRSPAALHRIFTEKSAEIDKTIEHLSQIQKALLQQKKGLQDLQAIDLSSISIRTQKAQKLVVLKTAKGIPPEKEAEMMLNEAHRHKSYRMYGILYGSMIPVASLYRQDFNDYQAIFLRVPQIDREADIHIQPAGNYLCAYCQGSWEKLPEKYEEILGYASDHHIQLWDYAYETGINETVMDSIDEYITRIEIPIQRDQA